VNDDAFEQRFQERAKPVIDALNPWQRAWFELDKALTQNSPGKVVSQFHHLPKSFAEWMQSYGSNPVWYLSDGGYSRVAYSWEDGTLFPTSNSTAKVKANWDAALPQRQQVEAQITQQISTLESRAHIVVDRLLE